MLQRKTPRSAMKLRQKILLLAVAPLTIAMLAIMLTVRHQSIALARHERQLVESAYLQAKETELRLREACAERHRPLARVRPQR